tara:strand:- start:25110 stop:25313 length:204 start_codon:yes stop_codon:yes gene_type:complete
MSCVFESPVHANGGCIFDNPLEVVSGVVSGGGIIDEIRPASRSRMEQQMREEDDILMMVAAAFMEIM